MTSLFQVHDNPDRISFTAFYQLLCIASTPNNILFIPGFILIYEKKFKYGLLLFSLCLQIPAFAYNEEKINALAQTFMQQNQVPGMSIAVIDQNKIHFYNLGWADPLKKFLSATIYLYDRFVY